MQRILALDLGIGSYGIALRELAGIVSCKDA